MGWLYYISNYTLEAENLLFSAFCCLAAPVFSEIMLSGKPFRLPHFWKAPSIPAVVGLGLKRTERDPAHHGLDARGVARTKMCRKRPSPSRTLCTRRGSAQSAQEADSRCVENRPVSNDALEGIV